jgi:hypothetical protein
MKKKLLLISALIGTMGILPAFGQKSAAPIKGSNEQVLQRLSSEVKRRDESNYQRAVEKAMKHGWVIVQTYPDGSTVALKGLDELGMPLYDVTYENTRAAATTATNLVWPGGSAGLALSGSSSVLFGKLGVWDTPVRLTHQEFGGRVVQEDGPATPGDHGTHVSGTMIAAGVNPLAKGMSFGAERLRAWNFSSSAANSNIAANASSLLVSNHSYGSIAGWRNNTSRAGTASDPTWEWWGDLSLTPANTSNPATDWKFGYYNAEARLWDEIAYNAPYYLISKSAGNNRNTNGPAVGQPILARNSNGTFTLMNRPAGISNNDGYDIISTYGNSKNILTVGAVNPIPNGYQKVSDVQISSFSSWGPTDDGRIKPDIVGNGVNLLSAYAGGDDFYASISGTSMSSPNVSGSIFLLQEHYSNLNKGNFMRAATLKGLILHTADEAGNPGPDYIYGWGLLNTARAAKFISERGSEYLVEEHALAQGDTYSFQVVASGAGPLVATISWTDPEGEVLPLIAANVNNRTPRLVNDLDIRISDGSGNHLPWILDPENPSANASRGDNFRDNVEQIYIANAIPGRTYTVTVSHKGTLARGPQAYSIIMSGIGGQAVCASGATASSDAKIDLVSFGTINNNTSDNCLGYRDFSNQFANVEINQNVPISVKLGTCNTSAQAIVKVFIDWNNDGIFDNSSELVATSSLLDAGNVFSTNVFISESVKSGTTARMRIVMVETTNPDDISACGTFEKGETQDYSLAFLPTSLDAGVASILSPSDLCGNSNLEFVTALIKNYGAVSQTNIPVTLNIFENGALISSNNINHKGTIPAFSEGRIIVPVNVSIKSGKTYTFEAFTSLSGDMKPINDSFITELQSPAAIASAIAAAYLCGTSSTALSSTTNGTTFWYDAATGGNVVAVGNQLSITGVDRTQFYAGVNDFSGSLGRIYNPATAGQNFSNNGVFFNASAPLIIESIRLKTAGTGTISIGVVNASGQVVSRTEIEVTSESPTAAVNGARVPLNLLVPEAGNGYRLTALGFTGTAGAWRDNLGAANNAGYPFTIANVMTITGSTATDNGFYHFMYEVKVKSAGCASEERTAVTAIQMDDVTSEITTEGSTTICEGETVLLKATEAAGLSYQWYRNGQAIPGATASTFAASRVSGADLTSYESSNYSVAVINESGCTKLSTVTTVIVKAAARSLSLTSSKPEICNGGTLLLTAVSNISGSGPLYKWFKDGELIEGATQSTYTATSKGKYEVEITSCTTLKAELQINVFNDEITANKAVVCSNGIARLQASVAKGDIAWFDALTGGNLVGLGNTFNTPVLTTDRSYFASAMESYGPMASPSKTSGGGFSNFTGGRMYFTAETAFILEKAVLNVGATGSIIVTLRDQNDVAIRSRTISLTSTGVNEYDINLYVHQAGNYALSFSFSGATAYRNNTTGIAIYPYTIPGVVSVTGNNQTTQSAFFYYLYDWKVKAAACSATPRTQVDAVVRPNITASRDLNICYGEYVELSAPVGFASYHWSNGESSQTIRVTQAGAYSVTVSDPFCTSQVSDEVIVDVEVVETPAIAVSGALRFCLGGSVELTAPEGYEGYLWSNGATTRSIIVNSTGDYSVKVQTIKCTSASSETVTVTVDQAPAKPVIFQNGTLLTTDVVGAIQWFRNGKEISGATSGTLIISSSGDYSVRATSYCGATFSDVLSVANMETTSPSRLNSADLTVYPNPFRTTFTVEYTSSIDLGPLTVLIFNSKGQQVGSGILNYQNGLYKSMFNGSHLKNGFYIIRVIGADTVLQHRILKQ